jgi:uncharacterized protein (TIGR03067 family)
MDVLLDGLWLPLNAELDGQQAPAMALAKMELRIVAERYQMTFGGSVADAGDLVVQPEGEQLTLELRATSGENCGRIVPAIAQLRGDRLRICFGMDGTRPTAFATHLGSARYLVSYRRV